MKSIKENISNELIINKSRFITELIKVDNVDEIPDILDKIRIKYPGANHYCYAYITSNEIKMSDDKEPSGTAGNPILNVLQKNDLSNILAIVIRYFGGIKLGAGGLVRAYSNSITKALGCANIISFEEGYLVSISYNYDDTNNMNLFLKDIKVMEKEFADNITATIMINNETLKYIKEKNIPYKIIKSCYIEKKQ